MFQRKDRHSVFLLGKYSEYYHTIREEKEPFVEPFPVVWDYPIKEESFLLNDRVDDQSSRTYVSNSCNGMILVCVAISFYLFNPSTHYAVKVSTLNYLDDKHRRDTWRGSNSTCKLNIGLYYDETISDYNAIVIIRHEDLHYSILVETSLKGKRWNHLNQTLGSTTKITVGPVLNGRLHWLVGETITWFDPDLKVFKESPSFQPPRNHTKLCRIVGIGILEGCLCVSRTVKENDDLFSTRVKVEILSMREYGVLESWTPIFSFPGEYIFSCNPLLLTRAGELFVSINSYTWVHNLGKKSFEKYLLPNEDLSISTVSFAQNLDMPVGYCWNQAEHETLGNTEDYERIEKFWKEIAWVRSRIFM